MTTLLAILRGPLDAGILYPQIWFAAAMLVLKLFDAWSTNYIVGRKGGRETFALARALIRWTGSAQGGLALDFALVAAAVWLVYPLAWPWIAGVTAWYAYWMAVQVGEVRSSRER